MLLLILLMQLFNLQFISPCVLISWIFFSRVYHTMGYLETLGKRFKRSNVACDVINFGDQYRDKKKILNQFINIVDNEGNCNICHVPPELSVCEALSRFILILCSVGLLQYISLQLLSLYIYQSKFGLSYTEYLVNICYQVSNLHPSCWRKCFSTTCQSSTRQSKADN